jgi:predicted CXXCH cytochrome family protein
MLVVGFVYLTGCGGERDDFAASASAASSPSSSSAPAQPLKREASAALSTTTATNVCIGTGAHDKHGALGFGCQTCHPCGGTFGFGTVTFPGGDSTANGTISPNGLSTTCSVGCHNPLGAAPTTVAWNHGPLACTDCHNNVVTSGAGILSSHVPAGTPATCSSCHDLSQHTTGQVLIRNADGTSSPANCVNCHSGQGQTLSGQTPPLLVGWTDAVQGDFHGARPGTCRFYELDRSGNSYNVMGTVSCPTNQPAQPLGFLITPIYAKTPSGAWAWTCNLDTVDSTMAKVAPTLTGQACPPGTFLDDATPPSYATTLVIRGFGGTLEAPFVRGQGALPCESCHDPHSSTNSFLFAATVNGTAIPAGAIDRAGVGAEKLCDACHVGDDPVSGRHAVCGTCHRAGMMWDSAVGSMVFDPSTPAADPEPAGSPCFACHGHDGLQNWPSPWNGSSHMAPGAPGTQSGSCQHCHSFSLPAKEYVPPVISQGSWSVAPGTSGYPSWLPNPAVWLVPNGNVLVVTSTSASIYWQTNEPSTSYVEYGVGTAGYVAGNDTLSTVHRVDLTGLTPNATYVWRIRTSDIFRNVTEPPLQTFMASGSSTLSAPTPTHEADQYNPNDAAADSVTFAVTPPLAWSAVTLTNGDTVQYVVQYGTDPSFASATTTSPVSGTSVTVNVTAPRGTRLNYYWRVQTVDATTSARSSWSSIDAFQVWVDDPYTW